MTDNKDNQEKNLGKKISAGEQGIEFNIEKEPVPEKKEISAEERIIAQQLRKEIEIMELSPELREEAKKASQKIGFLGEAEKLSHLLEIAQDKGVVYAVRVAKNMNEPYILDKLHDIFIENDYYKKFLK